MYKYTKSGFQVFVEAEIENRMFARALTTFTDDEYGHEFEGFGSLEEYKREELFDIPPEPEKRKKVAAKKEKPPTSESVKKIFFFKKAMQEYGFEDEALIDHFIAVRRKKSLVNTETAFKIFIREVEKTGKDKNEVFAIITQKQWGGFEAKWLKNLENEQSSNSKTRANGNGIRQSVER